MKKQVVIFGADEKMFAVATALLSRCNRYKVYILTDRSADDDPGLAAQVASVEALGGVVRHSTRIDRAETLRNKVTSVMHTKLYRTYRRRGAVMICFMPAEELVELLKESSVTCVNDLNRYENLYCVGVSGLKSQLVEDPYVSLAFALTDEVLFGVKAVMPEFPDDADEADDESEAEAPAALAVVAEASRVEAVPEEVPAETSVEAPTEPEIVEPVEAVAAEAAAKAEPSRRITMRRIPREERPARKTGEYQPPITIRIINRVPRLVPRDEK